MSPSRLLRRGFATHGLPIFRRKFTKAGASPTDLQASPDAAPPRIRAMRYNASDLEEIDLASADEAIALMREGAVLWVDVQGLADVELIRAMGERFDLHPLAISDVVNIGQRPKVEDYEDRLYAVVRMVTAGAERGIRWEQVSVFIGPGFVLSFQETYDDCLEPVRQRLRQGKKMIRTSGADYLGAMLIDAIVDGYFPVLEHYAERLEELETRVIESPEKSVLAEIYRVKRELMAFRRAVWPLRDALSNFLRDPHHLIDERVLPYIRDATDHVMQVVDVNETYRELASSFVDVYLSSVANRTNEVMRVLTILATLFIPLTFLAGIYGMNFVGPNGDPAIPELTWRYGYTAFWTVSAIMAIALLTLFWRLGWIGRARQQ